MTCSGEPIVREGDIADSLFFIKSGEAVAVRRDSADTVLARMRPGDVFGESALQVCARIALLRGESAHICSRVCGPVVRVSIWEW